MLQMDRLTVTRNYETENIYIYILQIDGRGREIFLTNIVLFQQHTLDAETIKEMYCWIHVTLLLS